MSKTDEGDEEVLVVTLQALMKFVSDDEFQDEGTAHIHIFSCKNVY